MSRIFRAKSIWIGLGLILSVACSAVVHAASSDNVQLRVTVNVGLSVDIGSSTYDFGGSLAANQTKISTGAIPVTNDSLGLTEDWQINGSNTADWTAHASTNTTTNNFNLRVLISSDAVNAPTYNDFNKAGDTNSLTASAPQNLSQTNFGLFTNGHGNDVVSATTKYLWFRMITPREISAGNNVQQSITVTVTAAYANTF